MAYLKKCIDIVCQLAKMYHILAMQLEHDMKHQTQVTKLQALREIAELDRKLAHAKEKPVAYGPAEIQRMETRIRYLGKLVYGGRV